MGLVRGRREAGRGGREALQELTGDPWETGQAQMLAHN